MVHIPARTVRSTFTARRAPTFLLNLSTVHKASAENGLIRSHGPRSPFLAPSAAQLDESGLCSRTSPKSPNHCPYSRAKQFDLSLRGPFGIMVIISSLLLSTHTTLAYTLVDLSPCIMISVRIVRGLNPLAIHVTLNYFGVKFLAECISKQNFRNAFGRKL